jgi:hypothetical protein
MASAYEVRFIQFSDGRLLAQQLRDYGGRYRWMPCEVLHVQALSEDEAQEARRQVETDDINRIY